MAVVSPPGFLQNAGTVHTAEVLRNAITGAITGSSVGGTLRTRGGVKPIGNRMLVQQAGAPNMSVDVLTGQCYVPGSEGATQGAYHVMNGSTTNVAIAAADPGNPRIDLIVVRIQDQFYSGGVNTATIERVAGTPAAVPAVPATPSNSLVLARVTVGAGVVSIVNANILDQRFYYAAEGGVITCTSTTRPTTANITNGQVIFEEDTNLLRYWVSSAAVWRLVVPYKAQTLLGGTTASITFSSIPTDLRSIAVRITCRSTDAGFIAHGLNMRVNSASTADYYTQHIQGNSASASAALQTASTSATIGLMVNSTATAGRFSRADVDVYGWNSPHTNAVGWTYQSFLFGDTGVSAWVQAGGGLYQPAGPYTSLMFFPAAGSFAAGTEIQIMGWD